MPQNCKCRGAGLTNIWVSEQETPCAKIVLHTLILKCICRFERMHSELIKICYNEL